jgi:hypothetical protein
VHGWILLIAACLAVLYLLLRLTDRAPPPAETFADLKVRLAKTMAFVQSFKPSDIDGSEDREINLRLGEHTMKFKGQPYLVHFVMPNFYFHCTTAYDILRHCGVELGKRDFIGTI